jgi:phage shock protein A
MEQLQQQLLAGRSKAEAQQQQLEQQVRQLQQRVQELEQRKELPAARSNAAEVAMGVRVQALEAQLAQVLQAMQDKHTIKD